MCGEIFVGLGSNMGGPVERVREAVSRLSRLPGTRVAEVSSLYITEPVGLEGQDWFVNGVVRLESRLDPRHLMRSLLSVEQGMGRTRTVRGGPRVIDLDLLLFGDLVVDETWLVIPHPRMHERRFVLVPLCEIAPQLVHPVLNTTMIELLEGLRDSKSVELLQPWGGEVCGFVGRY